MTDEYLVEDNNSCATTTTTTTTHTTATTRKNNQNTFSWSSTSSSFSNSTLLTQDDAATQEDEFSSLYLILLDEFFDLPTSDKKEKKLSEILGRAASHGDIHTVRQIIMDERLRPYLNLDASDDEENDGSTPLIYASCFGKLDIVKYLLQVGAKVDVQDKIGWTALMWATTNGHHQIVQVLLEYSASSETKSASGRTIYDLVDLENQDMISILNRTKLAAETLQLQQQVEQQQEQSPPIIALDTEKELLHCEESFRSVHKFSWDQCLPDQMFVFAQEEVDHILNVAISNLKLPIKSRSEIYVPANIIFLCARFAHYFTSRELVHELLSKAVHKIEAVIKPNASDIHTLAFWIANLSQLLYYLKKDAGLVVATAEHQLEISELISEAYTLLVLDSEKRMDRILEPAMVEFEQIEGLPAVEFADDWHRFFRRSRSSPPNRRSLGNTSVMDSLSSPPSPQLSQQHQQQQQQIRATLSPQSITSLMTSILYVLQSYDVHPVIVIQAMAQLFHFLSCEVFNRILFNKKHLCRSRALQIRMNLTVIEEWVREHHLPTSLGAYFHPVIQLVQLLQCVSQLTDLMDFIHTVKSFELLNPMQVKRLVLNYRYEVQEPKLPEEIEKYTMQLAEDTLKSLQTDKQQQQQEEKQSMDTSSSRPNSISSLGSLLMYSMSQQRKKRPNVNRLSVQSVPESTTLDDDACSMMSLDDDTLTHSREMIVEKRDAKYMLPFSLPTTTNMVHSGWNNNKNNNQKPVPTTATTCKENMSLSDTIYFELKQKMSIEREKNIRERSIIPTIPEEWLERLDHHTGQY